jgi:hypothetical protein
MTRLAIFALLGCSFLSVQAHVIRERALGSSSDHAQLAQSVNQTARSDSSVTGLGGGTTRALQQASDPRWTSTATPELAPHPPTCLYVHSGVGPEAPPQSIGTATPIRV